MSTPLKPGECCGAYDHDACGATCPRKTDERLSDAIRRALEAREAYDKGFNTALAKLGRGKK